MKNITIKTISLYAFFALVVSLISWWILSFFIPIDTSLILSLQANKEWFFAQRALIGVIIFGILTLILSLFYDMTSFEKPFVVYVLRISLLIYLSFYWYFKIISLWMLSPNYVLELKWGFIIWPFLLVINACMMAVWIIFEPWQMIMFNWRKKTKEFMVFINTVFRILTYSVFYCLFFWFSHAKYPINDSPILLASFFIVLFGIAGLVLRKIKQ